MSENRQTGAMTSYRTVSMELDGDRCYEAARSRDRRFDGLFFIGVTSTGIFCRPVCPARTPKRENVRFYRTAAAAESAGFRPCRRCRPETAPGSAAWDYGSDLVTRALTLIDEGALDDSRSEVLADRLAISERQLRRIFNTHLGTTPMAVARSRRSHLARRLLDDTDLPISTIAFAAGFGSVRQFNDVMRAVFDRTPSELRGRDAPASTDAPIRLRLSYRPPFDWLAVGGFIGERAIEGIETWGGETYRRVVRLGEHHGMLEVHDEPERSSLVATLHTPSVPALLPITSRLRRLFDLDADPGAVHRVLGSDAQAAQLFSRRAGVRIPGTWDPLEVIVRAVVGQQISVRAAAAIVARITNAYGKPVEGYEDLGLTRAFPTAADLAESSLDDTGVTARGAGAIRHLARLVAQGSLTAAACEGPESLKTALESVPGVGAWTSAYIALRAFGEPDAFPAADLGLRKAATPIFGRVPSAAELGTHAETWKPWRSYAALHLWMSLDD